jgi:hypothetical protein
VDNGSSVGQRFVFVHDGFPEWGVFVEKLIAFSIDLGEYFCRRICIFDAGAESGSS